jgi:hypothetical protein
MQVPNICKFFAPILSFDKQNTLLLLFQNCLAEVKLQKTASCSDAGSGYRIPAQTLINQNVYIFLIKQKKDGSLKHVLAFPLT